MTEVGEGNPLAKLRDRLKGRKDEQEPYLDQLRRLNSSEVSKQARHIAETLEASLLDYMLRPGSDHQVLNLTDEMMGAISGALHFGSSEEPLLPQRTLDAKSGLYGATKLLDPAGESYIPVEPLENVSLARRVLELAERRIGRIDPGTGIADIRIRTSKAQVGNTVKHHPKSTPSSS